MAKSVHDNVLDGAFNILNDGDIMTACNAEPTTRTQAVTTYALADVAMTPGTDYTIADDAVSPYGRKCTMAAKNGVNVDVSGDAIYIAICDATRLLYVTTCTLQTLTSGNTVNFPAWKVQIGDPT